MVNLRGTISKRSVESEWTIRVQLQREDIVRIGRAVESLVESSLATGARSEGVALAASTSTLVTVLHNERKVLTIGNECKRRRELLDVDRCVPPQHAGCMYCSGRNEGYIRRGFNG